MAKRRNIFLLCFSILAISISIYLFKRQPITKREAPPIKTVIAEQVAVEKTERGNSLEELVAFNSDTVGYLSVANISIGTPVVQNSDNLFYKYHDFDKNQNPLGCPYISSSLDLTRYDISNLTIFGSSSGQEELSFIKKYLDMDFLKENPYLCFENTISGRKDYEIVSVCYADEKEEDGLLKISEIYTFEEKEAFIDFTVKTYLHNIYISSKTISFTDRFLTLVSNSDEWNGAKIIVVARQKNTDEEPVTFEENPNVIYPNEWYKVNGKGNTLDYTKEYDRVLKLLGYVKEEKKEVEEVIPLKVGDKEAEAAIGKPIDTGEGTGTQGPSSGNNSSPPPVEYTVEEGSITVTSASTGRQISGTPLEIVSMIVEAEVGSSFHPEAIKAQAVAVITYLKYQYRTSSAPTVALLSASTTVKNCVAEVINTGMFYNGSIIYSPYCSSMAGRSNACNEVWVQNLPYLVSVESKYDSEVSGYSRTYTYSEGEMKKTLEEYYEITLSEDPNNWIQVLDYTSGGYVGNMSIDGKYSTTGSRFRANCMYIRSAAFTHSYDPDTKTFTITTNGYGHGVGMSQYGANFYAKYEGMNWQQILGHYYLGVTFGTVSW